MKFVHLHTHTQFSLLDGQAPIPALVDKAMADGMPGLAITDHGNMFGIKEFANYVNKKNGKTKDAIKAAEKALKEAEAASDAAAAEVARAELEKARSKWFKPIFGCEMYVARKDMHDTTDKSDRGRHLIVLAKNKTGYKNLIKLVSKAWTEGFYFNPRTDKKELEKHHEGLIVASACLGGELPQLILHGQIEEAYRQAEWWKSVFGDDYYIELQAHKTDKSNGNRSVYEEQMQVNPHLIAIARKLNIKMICTNDVHFVNEEDAEAHDRLICVSTASNFNDPKRLHYTKQEWFKSTAEMAAIFPDMPELMENTVEILNKVEEYSIDHAPIMPFFEIPKEFGTEEEYRSRLTEKDLFDEFTRDENGNVVLSQEEAEKKIQKLGGYDKLYRIKFEADYLRKLAYDGAKKRYGAPLSKELDERINFELHIMKTMGFPGYFLIVQDFISAAREQLGVSVGPGRGSAAGSCVAYCLGITQIDPIKYDLLFERFLNPDRISLPDIDIDFDDDGRADVLHYVTQKYGEEKVAHIITYGTMAGKSAIKDVARIEQLPLAESNRLSKFVPERPFETKDGTMKPSLKNCYKYIPELQQELNSPDPLVRETLEYARQLEGSVRNTGVHACGVIICRDDITDWVPVSTAVDKAATGKDKDAKLIVTQYEGKVIEETGLIKMDFLGLKTLTIIKETLRNIKHTTGKDIDIDNIPIDDPKTYKLYCEGRTTGTFQFESAGMQKYLRELQPSVFEDLIAMNALYRPGPMDYIPNFIERKHGRAPIEYDIPVMEQYLKDTYGVTVYQEQVMLLSRLLANFTRGQSDTLRKAMGKKQIAKMMELKGLFLEGGKKNGHDEKVLEKIWADWEKFASYAFNKSHATCYSWVAYQTAWLKANYPAEYMAAVMTSNLSNITKLTNFMEECKKMKIPVKGPDINESFSTFSVNSHGEIRFGMAAIKGVGENVIDAVVAERDQNGPFKSIYDVVERVPLQMLNRRTFESLALAGVFDSFEPQREDYFAVNAKGEAFSEQLLRYGQAFQADKQQSFGSLFGDDEAAQSTAGRPEIVRAERWADIQRLEKERELVGMYMSAHPLDPYYIELNYGCTSIKDQQELDNPTEGQEVTFGGLVTDFTTGLTKNGKNYGRLKIEDYTGTGEYMLFGNDFYNYRNFGIPGTAVLVTGRYERRFVESDLRFNITSIRLLDDVKGSFIKSITLSINDNGARADLAGVLADHIKKHHSGDGLLKFTIFAPKYQRMVTMQSSHRIHIDRELINTLTEMEIPFTVN